MAVTLNFSITIGKIKHGSLSILELVWGVIVRGVSAIEPVLKICVDFGGQKRDATWQNQKVHKVCLINNF